MNINPLYIQKKSLTHNNENFISESSHLFTLTFEISCVRTISHDAQTNPSENCFK